MNSPDDWKKRLGDTAREAADKHIDEIARRQRKAYLQAEREIERQVTALYERIRRDGEVTPLSLYKKRRFENMRRQIKAELKQLGAQQVKNCEEGFGQAVVDGYNDTGKLFNLTFDRVSKDFVDQMAHSRWSGEAFSARIWSNMSTLAQNVEKAVINSVVAGRGKDEAVREIMKATGQSFQNADRLVRTEVMHCINQAQANIYRQAGATRYEVLVGTDERTCPTCAAMDGAVFPFSQMREGINAPVFHPRCRCTIVPVLDDLSMLKMSEKHDTLTLEQAQAVTAYIGGESYLLNAKLREGIALSEKEENIRAGLDAALERLPVYQGAVYRSMDSSMMDGQAAFDRLHQPGAIVQYPAYSSASTEVYDPTMDYQLIIKSKAGVDLRELNTGEQEILFKRNSVFYVTKREKNTIYLEEL